MNKTFEAVVDYLEKTGLIKTARVMRKELAHNKGIILECDKENHLMGKDINILTVLSLDKKRSPETRKRKEEREIEEGFKT